MPLIVLTQDKKNIWELEVKDIWYEDCGYLVLGDNKSLKREKNANQLRCSRGLLGEYSSEEKALDALKNIWNCIAFVINDTVAIEIPEDEDVIVDGHWKIGRYINGEKR